MAFDPAPATWIPSWSEDGTDITVPLATFPEMTAGEADAATGDIRKVLYGICEALFQQHNTTILADRPTKMRINKSSVLIPSTGEYNCTYQFSFRLDVSGAEVTSE